MSPNVSFHTSPLAGHPLSPAGADLVMAAWTAEGCPEGAAPMPIAPLHAHPDDEAWYVLEGTLGFRIGEDAVEVGAGGAVIVPGGTPHTYWNPRPEPSRYLIVMTTRIRALIDAIHAAPKRDPESMRALFAQHGAELLGY